jgi:hypothetical protein
METAERDTGVDLSMFQVKAAAPASGLLPIRVVARHLGYSPQSLLSWAREGIGVGTGKKRIKLRTVSIGKRVYTTQRYLDAFIVASSTSGVYRYGKRA